jgi:DNA-binding NarL/FixJ family response regulator
LRVVQETNSNILLFDIQMPGMNAMDLVRKIKISYKQVKVLVLSAYREQAIVIGVMKAGADGYILKDEDIFAIPTAVRKVMAGLPCISPTVAQVLVIALGTIYWFCLDPSPLLTLVKRDQAARALGQARNDVISTIALFTQRLARLVDSR